MSDAKNGNMVGADDDKIAGAGAGAGDAMDMTDMTCRAFTLVLASKAPAPGGGSAAAFVGALGVALGNMVGALTAGKPKYAAVEDDILVLQAQASALQNKLLDLVAADERAFLPLAAAYKLPTETAEERAHKEAVMETCLRDAVEVPLAIMHACCEAIDLHEQFAAKGAAIALSDVGCGVICCKAALQAASLNVFINTKAMHERDRAEAYNTQARTMIDSYCRKAEAIFADVKARIS